MKDDPIVVRLANKIASSAHKHPEIATMRTTWELIRLSGFEYGDLCREFGVGKNGLSFSQLTVALRRAQKKIIESPAPKRRIRIEA